MQSIFEPVYVQPFHFLVPGKQGVHWEVIWPSYKAQQVAAYLLV